jgi:Immunity protein Imm1
MIEARIGGDGITADCLTAATPADKGAMIDQWLASHDVMFMEVKRDDPRSWEERREQDQVVEFMRVGVAGDRAAAEYVRNDLTSADRTIYATFNATPTAGPRVPYGYGHDFPPDTVVSLAEVRQLMIDFAVTGQWSNAAPRRSHDYLVA